MYSQFGRLSLLAVGVFCLTLFTQTAPANANEANASAFTLNAADAKLYRRIFTLNVQGDPTGARKLAQNLNDKSLLNWAGIGGTPPASVWSSVEDDTPITYISPLPRTAVAQKQARLVRERVIAHIRAGKLDWAQDTINTALDTGVIDRVEGAQITATLAGSYLYNNQPEKALVLGHLALQIGGAKVPQSAWIAGLASFKLGKYARGAQYFTWVPKSAYAGPWLKAAGAYWAARSLARAGHYTQVSAWLQEAAKHPRSFYGLIATRTLGSRFDFEWDVPDFNARHARILQKHEGAVRAIKLAQAGQMDMAQAELSLIDASSHSHLRTALAALAVDAFKPDLAMHMANMLQTPLGGALDIALYPVSPWHPKDGYKVDPALLNAFIRQESRFKPMAENKGSGAAGLMQIMPRTAKSLGNKDLKNPSASLDMGQKYLGQLLDMTGGNLFDAAIAYNAGPTRLNEWKRRFADVDDALLFIELIPYPETRAYVERVMANYWIYSLRMGHDMASLDAVAAGKVAKYEPPSNKGQDMLAFGTQ